MLPYISIKQLIISLIQRYCPFNAKYFQILVGMATAVLLGIVMICGWISIRKIKEVVTEDFNQQQLILSRHAAGQIENSLSSLKENSRFLVFLHPYNTLRRFSWVNEWRLPFQGLKMKVDWR
jgi:hypothetical protein